MNSFSNLQRSGRTYWSVVAILLLILLSPLTVDTVPPLLDYPIHLARSYIYNRYSSDDFLKSMFEIDWRPIPNLGSDIVLFFLVKILTIEISGRILLALIITLTVLGVITLHRVIFSQTKLWPLIVIVPAYHGALTAGFLNYSLGIAILPFFVSIYIILRNQNIFYATISNVIFAMVLYFCHVMVVGIFGVLLFGLELSRLVHNEKSLSSAVENVRNLSLVFVPFIIPACLYVKYSLNIVISQNESMILGKWSLIQKIRGLFMPIISGDYILDAISIIFITIIFIAIYASKKFLFEPGLILGCGIIFVIFVLLPGHLLQAAFIMDRLPIAILLILIASINPVKIEKRQVSLISSSILILTLLRSMSTFTSWQDSDIYSQRINNALKDIEPGSSVMIVSPFTKVEGRGFDFWHRMRLEAPNWHFALLNIPTLHSIPVLALTKRSAFTQLHFVWPDKQILSLSEQFVHLDYGDGGASTWHPDEIFVDTFEDLKRYNIHALKLTRDRWSLNKKNKYGSQKQSENRKMLYLSQETKNFDYILVVYANYLTKEYRDMIVRQFGCYASDDIVLAKVPLPQSWLIRQSSMHNRYGDHLETERNDDATCKAISSGYLQRPGDLRASE